MVWRLLSHSGSCIDGPVVSERAVANPFQWVRGRLTVDDSLMAIVVLVMFVWELLQLAIPAKTRGECAIDAMGKEGIFESPSFRDLQNVDCSFSQKRNEE